jgi:hypothetical protein
MDYCFQHKIPPAQSWAWGQAEDAYNKLKEKGENETH